MFSIALAERSSQIEAEVTGRGFLKHFVCSLSFLLLGKQMRWLEHQRPQQTTSDLEYGSCILKMVGDAERKNLETS